MLLEILGRILVPESIVF